MRSATYEGLADSKGYPQPRLLSLIHNLAIGGVGLIVPGFVYILRNGQAVPNQTGFYDDSTAQSWQSTISKIHQTPSKIIFQVVHAGAKTSPLATGGKLPLAPSAFSPNVREISTAEIDEVIQAFIQSAIRLKSIGADGIQLHAAHGFLLSSFLSPGHNRRSDGYGKDRTLIVSQIVSEIRKAVGPDFLIAAKINGNDFVPGGVEPQLAAEYVKKLENQIDLFEVSAQMEHKEYAGRINFKPELYRKVLAKEIVEGCIESVRLQSEGIPYFEGFNLESNKVIRGKTGKAKLAAVGGLLRFETLEKVIKEGAADVVSLSRPFLRRPNLVKLFEKGLEKAECIHCGLCFAPVGPPACRFPPIN
jgi:2,4-dienoyl-CoA reductase-like NADH-dependent reductase (Old Yellow Enzyme family)